MSATTAVCDHELSGSMSEDRPRLSDETVRRLKNIGLDRYHISEEQLAALESLDNPEKSHWLARTLSYCGVFLQLIALSQLYYTNWARAIVAGIIGLILVYGGYRIQLRIAAKKFNRWQHFTEDHIAEEQKFTAFVMDFMQRDGFVAEVLSSSNVMLFSEGYRPHVGVPNEPEANGAKFDDIMPYFIRKVYLDVRSLLPLNQARFEAFIDGIISNSDITLKGLMNIVFSHNPELQGHLSFESELTKIASDDERETFKQCWLTDAVLSGEARLLGWMYQKLFHTPYVLEEDRRMQMGTRTVPAAGRSSVGTMKQKGLDAMEYGTVLEIHFHQQDEASIYFESNAVDDEAKTLEILTFCCLAARQMSNLGFGGDRKGTAGVLAEALKHVAGTLEDIVTSGSPYEPRLVDYKGSRGRKVFVANLRYSGGKLNFQMDAKGFGVFARAVGYYAPNSVFLLLRYLAKRRIDDKDYIKNLSQAAFECGQAWIHGKIGLANQAQVALEITSAVGQRSSVEYKLRMAEQGDAESQAFLGLMYERGLEVPQNYTEALKWYRRAADQGHILGEWGLGILYANGTGVEQDSVEAAKWLRKAAEKGYIRAQSVLGMIYSEGRGVPQDYAEAMKWASKAAEQGDADAQFGLGLMYSKGWGVIPDQREAARWYQRAAEQGHERAKRNLREIL